MRIPTMRLAKWAQIVPLHAASGCLTVSLSHPVSFQSHETPLGLVPVSVSLVSLPFKGETMRRGVRLGREFPSFREEAVGCRGREGHRRLPPDCYNSHTFSRSKANSYAGAHDGHRLEAGLHQRAHLRRRGSTLPGCSGCCRVFPLRSAPAPGHEHRFRRVLGCYLAALPCCVGLWTSHGGASAA